MINSIRRFHIIQEEFTIDTSQLEELHIKIHRQGTVVYAFGIIPLFNEKWSDRHKEPRLILIVKNLQFGNTKSQSIEREFVTVTIKIAVVQVILAVAPGIYTKVGIDAIYA